MSSRLEDVLGEFHVDLEGRFEKVRTGETNLGNFVSKINSHFVNGNKIQFLLYLFYM